MEIKDYLGLLGRGLWVVIGVPLLAGAVALAFLASQPQNYRTTGTVAALGLSDRPTNSDQLVADFQGAVTSPIILNRVAQRTGVPVGDIGAGLTTARIETSSLLYLTYTTTDPDPAQSAEVVTTAANETIEFLLAPERTSVEGEAAGARAMLDRSEADLAAFIEETGLAAPDDDYRARQAELSNLRVNAEDLRASGETGAADALDTNAEELEEQLTALAPKALEFSQLKSARDAAQTAYSDALREAQPVVRPEVVTVSETGVADERIPELIARTGAVMAAALVLAILLVVLFDLTRGQPRSRRRGWSADYGSNSDLNSDQRERERVDLS